MSNLFLFSLHLNMFLRSQYEASLTTPIKVEISKVFHVLLSTFKNVRGDFDPFNDFFRFCLITVLKSLASLIVL